jgi:hypothetical protein
MFPLRLLLALLTAATVGLPLAVAQDPAAKKLKDDAPVKVTEELRNETHLRRVSENTYVHKPAGISFTVPSGWKEIPPHRLSRKIDPRITSVLGLERPDRELVASLVWVPMLPDQQLSHWVRETANAGEYGEEYETLKTVYGKDRVTPPVRFKSGPFDVYRMNISGGSDKPGHYDGVLYLFAVESGGSNWLVKVRISFPKGDQAKNDTWSQEILSGLDKMPTEVKKPATETTVGDK